MPFHWAIERTAEELRPLLDPGGQRNQPLDSYELKLVTVRLVDEKLGFQRIDFRRDERRVQKMLPDVSRYSSLRLERSGLTRKCLRRGVVQGGAATELHPPSTPSPNQGPPAPAAVASAIR